MKSSFLQKNNLVNILKHKLDDKKWDIFVMDVVIYNDSCQIGTTLSYASSTKFFEFDMDGIFEVSDALLYIRDTILKETGKRIWGLTYTLYPDGKYEIEYDYNVPEGFNEKGEWVGEEYENGEVSEFFDNIRNIGTDDFELK